MVGLREEERGSNIKAEYDFSKGKRGAILPQKGKTRIMIYVDNEVLEAFRKRADKAGSGYQIMMNCRSYNLTLS